MDTLRHLAAGLGAAAAGTTALSTVTSSTWSSVAGRPAPATPYSSGSYCVVDASW